ncbi:hypothetical protein Ptr902_12869 [Pyrenophora tritici-repentis]|nr:hypothetical protein Alg215_08078 [Pyrenophora tritici-repentis]KAI2475694.1 hypothetical protein Ptr902_12869 [Pyrenophora tritici-repentis]
MASADVSSAQFQEPPVNEIPEANTGTSTSSINDTIDAQFQGKSAHSFHHLLPTSSTRMFTTSPSPDY